MPSQPINLLISGIEKIREARAPFLLTKLMVDVLFKMTNEPPCVKLVALLYNASFFLYRGWRAPSNYARAHYSNERKHSRRFVCSFFSFFSENDKERCSGAVVFKFSFRFFDCDFKLIFIFYTPSSEWNFR